jgi:hypothetical protein
MDSSCICRAADWLTALDQKRKIAASLGKNQLIG